jgi:hypothetical protein
MGTKPNNVQSFFFGVKGLLTDPSLKLKIQETKQQTKKVICLTRQGHH